MKKPFIILCILFVITSQSYSQNFSNIELEAIYAIQKDDVRFFGSPNENRTEGWGTSYFALRFNKRLFQYKILSIQGGIGYAREINSYKTPYDQCFDRPGEACQLNLPWIDKYRIDLIQVPLILDIRIIAGLSFACEVTPQIDFFKRVKGHGTTSLASINLYSVEVIPRVKYTFQRLSFNLGLRCFQLKKIDSVYLYGGNFLAANPDYLDNNFDTFNPTKILLSIGYRIM